MLVLTRKVDQSIVINGNIEVQITKIEGDLVKIGIRAPRSVPIHRKEVFETIHQTNKEAASNYRLASATHVLTDFSQNSQKNNNSKH